MAPFRDSHRFGGRRSPQLRVGREPAVPDVSDDNCTLSAEFPLATGHERTVLAVRCLREPIKRIVASECFRCLGTIRAGLDQEQFTYR